MMTKELLEKINAQARKYYKGEAPFGSRDSYIAEGLNDIIEVSYNKIDTITPSSSKKGKWVGLRIIVLTLCIIAGTIIISCSVFAGGSVIDSGTCGEKCNWTLNDEHILRIEGTGATGYVNDDIRKRWSDVDTLIVEEGITEIGDNLKLYGVKTVQLPRTLDMIGKEAFINCKSLTFVTLPEGLEYIAEEAFRGCEGLKKVTIPSSVEHIGPKAFSYSGIEEIDFSKPDEKLYIHRSFTDTQLKKLIIPGNISFLNAFENCDRLTDVIILEGSEEISSSAFCSCDNLQNVTIPTSVKEVSFCAFENCDSLRNVYYLGSKDLWHEIYIDLYAGGNSALLNARILYNSTYEEGFVSPPQISPLFGEIKESSSTVYNPELAYMMMEAANAAYRQENGVEDYLFNDLDLDYYRTFNYYIDPFDSRYKKDSTAYSIGYKDTDDGRIVTVIIRGTYNGPDNEVNLNYPDWASNFNTGLTLNGLPGWHKGFSKASEEIYNQLALEGLLQTSNKYVITGHSRGGATGNLLAVRMHDLGIPQSNVFNYNFACPDTNYGFPTDWNPSGVHNNIFNINYCGDIVSKIPGVVGNGIGRTNLAPMLAGNATCLSWGKYGHSVWYADNWNNFGNVPWDFSKHDGEDIYLKFLEKKKPFSYYKTWMQMNTQQIANTASHTITAPSSVFKAILTVIACPVDVIAKDASGNTLATVINNEVSYYCNSGEIIALVYGESKWFYTPEDSVVTFEIKGIDDGTMQYGSYDIDMLEEDCEAITEASNVIIEKDKQFTTYDDVLYVTNESGEIVSEVKEDGSESMADPDNLRCGHRWGSSYTVDKNASCKVAGLESIHCRKCNEKKEGSTRTIAKKAHTYGTWKITKQATYTSTGTKERVCNTCGNKEQVSIPKLAMTSIAKSSVTKITNKTYTGKNLTQAPVVKVGNKTLKKGTDYKLTYKNNKKIGKAIVVITGIGGYTGTVNITFLINPKGTSLSKLTATKKGFTAKWKKQATQTTGYQIQYSTNKKFKSGNKTVTVGKNKTISKKIAKLKAKKKYFVRARTYKTVSGKKYYSGWSKSKVVTTK